MKVECARAEPCVPPRRLNAALRNQTLSSVDALKSGSGQTDSRRLLNSFFGEGEGGPEKCQSTFNKGVRRDPNCVQPVSSPGTAS